MPALLFRYVLPFFFLVALVGAAVLWTKTRRAAALVQMIACLVIFLILALEQVAEYLMRAAKPQLLNFINGADMQFGGQILLIICFVALPIGYLWYALTQKRT
ncbi:MAG: hypothetical protein DME97_08075 [Verrucomicrobia bacterium]|nr:MAG: hypothetical protein DME97_08075 [Verrucomicrobiota bacterium]